MNYVFESEIAFEQAIRKSLGKELSKHTKFEILTNKKVADILICYNSNHKSKLFFLEVKYHKTKHGRLPIGQQEGKGFQPELLQKQPKYFENHLKWVFGSQTSQNFILLDTPTLFNNYIQGNSIGIKHNGAKKALFGHNPSYSYDLLINEIVNWLLSSV